MTNQFIKHNLLLPLLVLPLLFSNSAKPLTNVGATYTAPYEILNPGFETGNLDGWTSFSIWKGEDGMTAWTNDRVVNGTYFDGGSYNRDGAYNLGIYGGNISKDSGQERMGHLRSSNFTLGGTGWMSFKLGGGKNSSFEYVSVRRASNDLEVARFGNPNFNHPEISGTANAEAYMFQYYFDLSPVASLNDILYVTISDNTSFEWAVLSADSFFTYYPVAPTVGANQLATNIVPVIQLAGTATASIPNGHFADNLDSWTNVNGVFERKDEPAKVNGVDNVQSQFAQSSLGGDGAIGVLRSSAFKITTDLDHIQLSMGGYMKSDKKLFCSIKEVGTNIELLRYIRREDRKDTAGGDLDNNTFDLSSLSAVSVNKEYYLEFSENVTDGWGVIRLDNVRLITDLAYSSVSSNEYAVSLSGVPSSFPSDAVAYATRFISDTASYCSTLSGGTMATDTKWTTLANAYSALNSDAKDYFVNNTTGTDSNVVAARARYVYLIGKYASLHDNNFLADSTGAIYHATVNGGATLTNPGNLSSVLIVIIGITVLAGVSYVGIRKKRNQN